MLMHMLKQMLMLVKAMLPKTLPTRKMSWPSSTHLKSVPLWLLARPTHPTFPHLLEGIPLDVFQGKTPILTRCTPERHLPSTLVQQGMVQNSILKFTARSFASLLPVHMLQQGLRKIFDSGRQKNKCFTRSFTVRKVFFFTTSILISEAFHLSHASRTLLKLLKLRI